MIGTPRGILGDLSQRDTLKNQSTQMIRPSLQVVQDKLLGLQQ